MKSLVASSMAALAFAASPSFAANTSHWQPTGMSVQGASWAHVDSATVGLTWDWHWRREYAVGTLTGYTEMDLARWRTRGRVADKGFTQFGVSPVLRLYPAAVGGGWFAEAGIGPNWISPKYRNDTREFSTTFNFGDRIAIGRRFGEQQAHEISVGFEHFSNAGIKHPNPGENFVQVRYACHF